MSKRVHYEEPEEPESEETVNKRAKLRSDEKHAESEDLQETEDKLPSAEEILQQIRTSSSVDEIQEALENLLKLCNEEATIREATINEFCTCGGSALELFEILESQPLIPIEIPLEIVTAIVLQAAGNPNLQPNILEACRYILKTHLNVINKMMKLSSTATQRHIILRLLTAMVAFSPKIVTDIFDYVSLYPQLMSRHDASSQKSVRLAWINFLLAFFLDEYHTAIRELLAKPYYLFSIFPGLKYDPPETVHLVLGTLRQFICDPVVPKPLKLKLFRPPVLKSLLWLYDWKGPGCMDEKLQRALPDGDTDATTQMEIASSVHTCLLPLCTSIKRGVIFRDDFLGTGDQHRNPLMYNIVETFSLDNNELQRELIVKITAACPDVVRSVWTKLLPSLEVPGSKEWFAAVSFFQQIIKAMDPKHRHIINHAECLPPKKYAQLIQLLVAPSIILKLILPEDFDTIPNFYRLQVVTTILTVLEAVDKYLSKCKAVLTVNYHRTLHTLLLHLLEHTLPTGLVLMNQLWKATDCRKVVVDVLTLYQRFCPDLLIGLTIDAYELFESTQDVTLRLGFLTFYHIHEPNAFTIVTETFPVVLAFLAKCLRMDAIHAAQAHRILVRIFTHAGLFGDASEMLVWIDAMRHRYMAKHLHQIIIASSHQENLAEFDKLKADLAEESEVEHLLKVLERSDGIVDTATTLKRISFSCVTFTALKIPADERIRAPLGAVFLNIFHLQTEYKSFQNAVVLYGDVPPIPKEIKRYIMKWPKIADPSTISIDDPPVLQVARALFRFVHGDGNYSCETILDVCKTHPLYYLIYGHPKLLQLFEPGVETVYSKFLVELTEWYKAEGREFNAYLKPYQRKIYEQVMSKQGQHSYLAKMIRVFGMGHAECQMVIKYIADTSTEDFNLIVVVFRQLIQVCMLDYDLAPLPDDDLRKIANILLHLNNKVDSSELARSIYEYLARFFHQKQVLDVDALFISVACKQEYCKDNAQLLLDVLEDRSLPTTAFMEHLEDLIAKKGLILKLLDRFHTTFDEDEALAAQTFARLLPMIQKTLAKPHKAGVHLERHYKGLCALLRKCMPIEDIQSYVEKIQRFDTCELFLVEMLKAMYVRYLNVVQPKDKHIANILMTFVHLLVHMFKKSKEEETEEICRVFTEVIGHVKTTSVTLHCVQSNDTYTLLVKYCLQHGVDVSRHWLLALVTDLSKLTKYTMDETTELLELLLGHSQFMPIVLEGPSQAKFEMFHLMHVLVKGEPVVMESRHVPILLSAYTATMHPADRKLLALLQMYEAQATQTCFYDLRPFLWGTKAWQFYSQRQIPMRYPYTRDILKILDETMIQTTIVNDPRPERVYDLQFLLPVFSQVLSAENTVNTKNFTRSGALSLVLIALASNVNVVRQAGCHILSRFHNHLQTARMGKLNREQQLWLRFVEAVAKGTSAIDDYRLNHFAAIFMARTALVLSNPTDKMYLPLSNYIFVKAKPDFGKLPELYTFLHSSDVEHALHRAYLLEVLTSGMQEDADYAIAVKSHAFKLVMELATSVISAPEVKEQVLELLERATRLPVAVKGLCQGHGLLVWLYHVTTLDLDVEHLVKVLHVYRNVMRCPQMDYDKMVDIALMHIADHYLQQEQAFSNEHILELLHAFVDVAKRSKGFLTETRLRKLLAFAATGSGTWSKVSDYCLEFKVRVKNPVSLTQQLVQIYLGFND